MQTKIFTGTAQDNNMLQHAYSILISKLYMLKKDKSFKTITVTSCNPKEGKTSFCTALAIALAGIGKQTLLVNLDLRKKDTDGKMPYHAVSYGISNYLKGDVELNDTLCKTNIENMYFLDSGKYFGDPVALLCCENLRTFFEIGCNGYDYVIIDTPALECNTDALVVSEKSDATILVAKMGHTTIKDIRKAQAQLNAINANVLGVVLNKSSKRFYRKLFSASNYFKYGKPVMCKSV